MRKRLIRYTDDMLLVTGCLCILYGLSIWSEIATWLAAGGMLIGFGVMVGKAKANHAAE